MKLNTDKFILAIANAALSSSELAEKSKISQVTIARVKAGTQQPRPQTLGKLAKALNVKVEDLV